MSDSSDRDDSADACACGHSIEEHGHNDEFPNSMECSECDCIAYESDGGAEEEEEE